MEDDDIIARARMIALDCGSIAEVKRRLIREGYLKVNARLSGWQIKRDLMGRINSELKDRLSKTLPDQEGES